MPEDKSKELQRDVPLKKEPIVIPDKPTVVPPQKTAAAEILVLSVTDSPFTSPSTQKYQVLVETSQLLQLNRKYKLVL